MLDGYSRAEAIAQMNEWGEAGCPFLFVIDYRQEQVLLHRLDELPVHIQFHFPHACSSPTPLSDTGRELPLPPTIVWEKFPPSLAAYARGFHCVKAHLALGNSFLVNYTCRVPISTNLSLEQLYHHTRAPYRLWVAPHFVCYSPECFVKIIDGQIHTFPMKGTIDASLPQAEKVLLADKKEAAEHATVVDLLRNDLSIVAQDVHVERYRYVEKIESLSGAVLQTSSEIVGQLPVDFRAHLGDILFDLLPAGSITGAPKCKTQAIIAEAEDNERGFYTGVMGVFDGRDLDSAVMIRFVEQDSDGSLVYKAGGGITHRSQLESEYQEMCEKVYAPIVR